MTAAEAIGFSGLALYGVRSVLQWLAAERRGWPVVPRGFWQLSLAAAALETVYALAAEQAVFLLTVLPEGFVYVRNLMLRRRARVSQLVPVLAALVVFLAWAAVVRPYPGTRFWAVLGFFGSAVFSSRFVVQWWLSERRGRSHLPAAFWILSLAGALPLIAYGFHRADRVLVLAYVFAWIPYVRNLMLLRKRR